MIKKFFCIFLLVFVLSSCSDDKNSNSSSMKRYNSMIEQLKSRTDFKEKSEYFDINLDVVSIDKGYRFYVIIDNCKLAMYNIEAIAIENNVDYSEEMAANIGLFEEFSYSMIPNQTYIAKGFVKGISISGISKNEKPVILVLVTWTNKDLSITKKEFFRLEVSDESE